MNIGFGPSIFKTLLSLLTDIIVLDVQCVQLLPVRFRYGQGTSCAYVIAVDFQFLQRWPIRLGYCLRTSCAYTIVVYFQCM